MADIQMRSTEDCAADLYLLWDTKWDAARGFGDWALAGASEVGNRGGLSAAAGLETDVVISLFTDRRIPENHPLAYLADGEKRGWWGDAVDLQTDRGEAEIGSLLWLLRRAPLTAAGMSVARWAEIFANEALAHLIVIGAAARIDVSAVASEINNRLELTVAIYGRDGVQSYSQNFELLWKQVAR